jgi:putative transposase
LINKIFVFSNNLSGNRGSNPILFKEAVEKIDSLSISRQCELLQLPRSSYFRPRSYLAEGSDNLALMSLIDEESLRHPFYGSGKMKEYLNRKGIPANRKRI